MTSPIKVLKTAIQEKSWALANEAYEMLTGETIDIVDDIVPPEKKKRGRPKKVVATKPPTKAAVRPKASKASKADKSEESPAVAVLANGRPNLWVDDGSLDPELRIIHNPKLGIKVNTGQRAPFRTVPVTCYVCGHKEEVSQALAPKRIGDSGNREDDTCRWRCNKCACGR